MLMLTFTSSDKHASRMGLIRSRKVKWHNHHHDFQPPNHGSSGRNPQHPSASVMAQARRPTGSCMAQASNGGTVGNPNSVKGFAHKARLGFVLARHKST